DDFGKLNLTKITRYRKLFEETKNNLLELGIPTHNAEHIKESLLTGVNSLLSGEVFENKYDFRNTIFSYSAAVEEMSNLLLKTFRNDEKYIEKTLGQKLGEIRDFAEVNPNYFINIKVLEDITKLINSLRNNIVHPTPGDKNKTEILRAQSNITHQIAIAFIRFAANAINSFKDQEGNLLRINEITSPNADKEYIFGFDGDNTGDFLDDSFKLNDEKILIEKSNRIKKAISKIKSLIRKNSESPNPILFAEGDNILFRSKYNHSLLKKFRVYILVKQE
ncbi:MAG: hypothetical protein AAF388_17485, partial [Bacteroidota bacterium]